ncbi:MAG TPA: DUF5060 domain-containing protein [Thermoanaerobaculia bacterium]|jgi:hypothetical protein|nr:DUF5060 domain-containing protein [Thermoanaerobaculia bacterium]
MRKPAAQGTAGLLAIVILLVASAGAARAQTVPRFGTAEVTLRSAAPYDGGAGTPNPFTDVTLTAQVTAPSGRVYPVDGFFDGDGLGGQAGSVFKLRVFADEPGTWTWQTASSDPSLAGRSGSFDVAGIAGIAGTLPGRFGGGPIEVDPGEPRAFRYRLGGPVFLVGKFLDEAAPAPIQYSHTWLSEALTDADRQALLDRHTAMRVNKMNVYVANQGDYSGTAPTTPWLGTAASNDKSRFDLARWHLYERWLLVLRDRGIAAHLWFFADDSGFGALPEADRYRLVAYTMARLSPYVHTLFTLGIEWQKEWTAAEVDATMTYASQHNPWHRLLSVHGVAGDTTFATAPWLDFMTVQVLFGSNAQTVHDQGLKNRGFAAKPLMMEEFHLGAEDGAGRHKTWASFTAGAAGVGTGAYLAPFASFVSRLHAERLAPADDRVVSGSAWGVADPGRAYVFYLPVGGTVGLDLAETAVTLDAMWIDPQTGAPTLAPAVAGGAVRTLTAPTEDRDWVLWLAAPAGFFTLSPCRLLDTREGPQGPALASGERRGVLAAGVCGVPPTARAVAVNLTVTGATGAGYLAGGPGGAPPPFASSLNYAAGQTRSNNAILPLGPDGTLTVAAGIPGQGSVHLILDIDGWFE